MAQHILSCCTQARLPLKYDKKLAYKDGPSVTEVALALMLNSTAGESQSYFQADLPFKHYFGNPSKHAVETSKC